MYARKMNSVISAPRPQIAPQGIFSDEDFSAITWSAIKSTIACFAEM
jgi:hypothetical protein